MQKQKKTPPPRGWCLARMVWLGFSCSRKAQRSRMCSSRGRSRRRISQLHAYPISTASRPGLEAAELTAVLTFLDWCGEGTHGEERGEEGGECELHVEDCVDGRRNSKPVRCVIEGRSELVVVEVELWSVGGDIYVARWPRGGRVDGARLVLDGRAGETEGVAEVE